ncbi:MAG: T9SS C-terminal target domain-containing protein, partial [Ignavibacteriales bacterium]
SVGKGQVNLNWQTATETNNYGFEIERKAEGQEFTKVGFVGGYVTTTESMSYNFVDKNLTSGNYTYRLKQIDFDGTFEYSPEVEVDFAVPSEFSLLQNFPNPFNPSTRISFTLPVESNVTIKLFNVIGEELNNLAKGSFGAGVHNIDFNASGLNSGVYFYSIEAVGIDGNIFSEVKKMMFTK